MKILILGFTKMKFMPYASFYLEQINFNNNEVHVVYWNRDLLDEDLSKYNASIQWHEFFDEMDDSIPKKCKLKHFWNYRKFVSSILKKYNFDKIVSLHSLPGLLILDKLKSKRYHKKYILDYRDSTFEENMWFRKLVGTLVNHAEVVFTSSDGFRKYLPTGKTEILTTHNILTDSLLHRDDRKKGYVPNDRIRISFWGLLRHTNHNKLIIDRLGNDIRFELHYFGRELVCGKILREHCVSKGIKNVYFHGEYSPEDRFKFACVTDVIHNNYLDDNMLLAMGNKYYDGIIFRIPQLCMPGSYMGERCQKKGVGFSVDPQDLEFADKVYENYKKINQLSFNFACDDDLIDVIKTFNESKKRVKSILNS